jgi:hypothetical protein
MAAQAAVGEIQDPVKAGRVSPHSDNSRAASLAFGAQ